ncbi:hypothetical protein [Candidatus Nanohalococcus occultus]|uniref:hypothetical protein n=1 Tax=Candidatus Nanohalococcus occultus TaxID=2978047 RepID=UPI0039E1E481
MRKTVLLIGLLVFTSIAAAPGMEPSHPLSHIHPIDEDFNMSNMRIFNVSRLSVNGGLKIDGNQILDSGANPILNYNDNDQRLELENTDFGTGTNNITSGNNVSFNNSLRVHGGKVWIPEGSGYGYFYRKNLSEVLEDGNNATVYDIQMNGNDLKQLDEIRTDGTGSDDVAVRDTANGQDIFRFNEGGNVEVPNGVLDMSDNSIDYVNELAFRPKTAGASSDAKINYDTGGNNLNIVTSGGGGLNNDVSILDNQNGNQRIAEFEEGGRVIIPNGNLDMSGNNITNINWLKFEEGTSIDGDLTVNGTTNFTGSASMSEDLDMNDNDILDANNVQTNTIEDPEDGTVSVNDNVDVNDNDIQGVDRIRAEADRNLQIFTGSGSGSSVEIYDQANAQQILTASEGGNVDVPNGNLVVNGTIAAADGNRMLLRPSDGSAWYDMADESGTFVIQQVGDQDVVRIDQNSHEFNLPNGDLDLNSNNVEDVASIDGGGDAVRVDNNVDLNGNSVTTSTGEVCIGNQCA